MVVRDCRCSRERAGPAPLRGPQQIPNRQGANRKRLLRKGFDEIVEKMDLSTALRSAGLADDEVRPGCDGLMAKLGREAQPAVSAR